LPTSARTPARTRWAGVPAEDRRANRRELLLDTAFDLLGSEGAAGTTVRAVCQRAALNPRYFYESFDDLDALVVAVYDRVVGQLGAEVAAAIEAAGDDAGAQLHAAVDRVVGFVDEDPRRGRVLYVEALGNEALNRRRLDTGHAVVAFVARTAAERHGGRREGEQIGSVGAAVLVGGLSELMVSWLDGRIDVSRTQLVDDATALFVAMGEAAASIAGSRRK